MKGSIVLVFILFVSAVAAEWAAEGFSSEPAFSFDDRSRFHTLVYKNRKACPVNGAPIELLPGLDAPLGLVLATEVEVPETGTWKLAVTSPQSFTVYANGRLVINEWRHPSLAATAPYKVNEETGFRALSLPMALSKDDKVLIRLHLMTLTNLAQEPFSVELKWFSDAAGFQEHKLVCGQYGEQPTVTSTTLFDTVIYQGHRYATLDGDCSANSCDSTCQTTELSVPSGWSVASSGASSTAVATGFGFGADCLVVNDGNQIMTKNRLMSRDSNLDGGYSTPVRNYDSQPWRISLLSQSYSESTDQTSFVYEVSSNSGGLRSVLFPCKYLDALSPTRVMDSISGYPGYGWRPDSWSTITQLTLVMPGNVEPVSTSVILSGSSYYTTTTLMGPSCAMSDQMAVVRPDSLTCATDGNALLAGTENKMKPRSCLYRGSKVLIRQNTPTSDPLAIDRSVVEEVTNFISFHGKDYATVDNAPFDDSPSMLDGCQHVPAAVPEGWSIADNTPDVRAALIGSMDRFNTRCVVLADGSSFMPNGGKACGNDALTVFSLSGDATGKELYAPNRCYDNERRILITRTSRPGQKETMETMLDYNWDNHGFHNGKQFATMQDSHIRSPVSGCQTHSIRLPYISYATYPWALSAVNSADAQATIAWGSFGADALLGAGGSCTTKDLEDCSSSYSLLHENIPSHTHSLVHCANPHFAIAQKDEPLLADGWGTTGQYGYALNTKVKKWGYDDNSIELYMPIIQGDPADEYNRAGAEQQIEFLNPLEDGFKPFKVLAWSKAENVQKFTVGEASDWTGYAMQVDLKFIDNSGNEYWTYGLEHLFQAGTHDWELGTVTVTPSHREMSGAPAGARLHVVLITLVLQGYTGHVYFAGHWVDSPAPWEQNILLSSCHHGDFYAADSCNARVLMERDTPPADYTLPCGKCITWGDPHISSFDSNLFDFHGVGDYLLVEPQRVDESLSDVIAPEEFNWRVDARQDEFMGIAINIAGAAKYKDDVVVVKVSEESIVAEPEVFVNGQPVEIERGIRTSLPSGVAVEKYGETPLSPIKDRLRYRVEMPNKVIVEITTGVYTRQLLMIEVSVPNYFRKNTRGLCGLCDDDIENDWIDYYGQYSLPRDSSMEESYEFLEQNYKKNDDSIIESTYSGPTVEEGYKPNFAPCEGKDPSIIKLADETCDRITSPAMKLACRTDICILGTADVVDMTLNAESGSGQETTEEVCAEASITEFIEAPPHMGGRTYALLDNTSPLENTAGCQETAFKVPSGWMIAKEDHTNKAFLSCYPWGTDCIVFGSGRGLTPALEQCGTGIIGQTSNGCTTVKKCNSRILLTRDTSLRPANSDFAKTHKEGDKHFIDSWTPISGTQYEIVTDKPLQGFSLLTAKMDISAEGSYGLSQGFEFYQTIDRETTTQLSVVAWSKIENGATNGWNAAGTEEAFYGLYLDLKFILPDGTEKWVYGLWDRFSADSFGWQVARVSLNSDVFVDNNLPSGTILKKVWINLLARHVTGTVYFSGCDFEMMAEGSRPSANLLRLATFPSNAEEEVKKVWLPNDNGYTFTPTENYSPLLVSTSGAIELENADANSRAAAWQWVPVNQQNLEKWEGIYIGGWHKAIGVEADTQNAFNSFYVDISYTNGEYDYGKLAAFTPGTHDWEWVEAIAPVKGSIQSMSFNAIFRNTKGKVLIDGPVLLPSCYKPREGGVSHGDPHYVSSDGARYDVQTRGEFVLHQDPYVMCQARHEAAGDASVTSAVACLHYPTGRKFSIERPTRAYSSIDDVLVLDNNSRVQVRPGATHNLGKAGSISVRGKLSTSSKLVYTIRLTSGSWSNPVEHKIMIEMLMSPKYGVSYIQTKFNLPKSMSGSCTGLLGNCNGIRTDDVFNLDRYGRKVYVKTDGQETEEEMNAFAEIFRVKTSSESLFRYSGKNLEFFNTGAAPPFSASPEQMKAARAVCGEGRLPNSLVKECALDVIALGDESVATAYAETSVTDTWVNDEPAGLLLPPSEDDGSTSESAKEWSAWLVITLSSAAGFLLAVIVVIIAVFVVWQCAILLLYSHQKKNRMRAVQRTGARSALPAARYAGEDKVEEVDWAVDFTPPVIPALVQTSREPGEVAGQEPPPMPRLRRNVSSIPMQIIHDIGAAARVLTQSVEPNPSEQRHLSITPRSASRPKAVKYESIEQADIDEDDVV